MAGLDKSEIARLLHEFGQRTAFRGGNPYRARAYTRAAENLLAVPEPLETLIAQNRLKEIPGGALELLEVPGLRPEKALKLHRELGISSLEQLEAAAQADRLRPVRGLGAALQKK